MNALTLKLLEMSLHGALLILIAAFIRLCLLRILPKGMLRLLWVPAILALLIPLPALFSLSLPLTERAGEPLSVEEVETDRMDWDGWEALPAAEGPGLLSSADGAADSRALPLLPRLWLAGMGLTGLSLLVLYLLAYARLGRASPLGGEEAEAWLRGHPVRRRLSLRLLPGLRGPMTCGVLRPVILLPEEPDWESLPSLLALEHEYVHVRHLDAAWKQLLHLLLVLHWFNPAVWLMFLLLSRDLELSCDETVLRRFGRDLRTDFARMLVDAGRRNRLSPFPGLGAGGLRERVNAVMRYRRAGIPRRALALVLALGLALCALCTVRVGAAGETLYRNGDVLLSVPRELKDLLIVETPALTGGTDEVLFRVLERESWEAGQELFPDSRLEHGLLLTIRRMDEETAAKCLRQATAWDLLARDARGYYYLARRSTVEANMLTSRSTEDQSARWERRKLVNAWVRDLRGHMEWREDLRTLYPAHSATVSSYLAGIMLNRTHRCRMSWGDVGPYELTGNAEGDAFLARLTWETATASARVGSMPQGEPIVVNQPHRDMDLYFWPGSDLVLYCSNRLSSSDIRRWYTVTLLDEPEAKVGDLAAAWFRAMENAG